MTYFDSSLAGSAKAPCAAVLGQQRKRILLANDDWSTRKLLANLLGEDGFEVLEARDGDELASLLQSSARADGPASLDLVISDVCVRGAFGFHALACVRKTHPTVPVILVTTSGTFGGVSARDDGARLCGGALLDKRYKLGALRDLVRRLTRSGA